MRLFRKGSNTGFAAAANVVMSKKIAKKSQRVKNSDRTATGETNSGVPDPSRAVRGKVHVRDFPWSSDFDKRESKAQVPRRLQEMTECRAGPRFALFAKSDTTSSPLLRLLAIYGSSLPLPAPQSPA